MKKIILLVIIVLILISSEMSFPGAQTGTESSEKDVGNGSFLDTSQEKPQSLIFGAFAEGEEQLKHTLILVESIRTFAGIYKNSPVWIYVPEESLQGMGDMAGKFRSLDAEVRGSQAPRTALQFPYSRKVFAAAEAEAAAEGKADILVWMDDDTVFLNEPDEFDLKRGVAFGYRPVMHQLIGSLYSEPLDEFWTRVYQKLSVPETAIFPMTTPADSKTIRPYFNAGLLVVRPEKGIL